MAPITVRLTAAGDRRNVLGNVGNVGWCCGRSPVTVQVLALQVLLIWHFDSPEGHRHLLHYMYHSACMEDQQHFKLYRMMGLSLLYRVVHVGNEP